MPRAKFETDQQYERRNLYTIAYGVTSGSTDNTGSLVINYSLASAPNYLSATVLGTTQAFFTITNMTATGSTLRLFGTGSGALLSTAVTASWLARV
jgi:hypothetical protein